MRALCNNICSLYNININSENDEEYYKSFCDIVDSNSDFLNFSSNKLTWSAISALNLTQDFCEKFEDKLNWRIVFSNKLDESFLRKFSYRKEWGDIASSAILNESFIAEFADKLNWKYISAFQRLSEKFIRTYSDRVDWKLIAKHQKLSEEFIKEYKLIISPYNWLYKTKAFKLNYIRTTTTFKIENQYIIGYINYKCKDKDVISNCCNCLSNDKTSFGLYVFANDNYCKVRVHINDLGTVLDRETLRCFKFEIID
jgi:hypothetical protein